MQPKIKNIVSWTCAGIAAVIMLQTLFFKFTAAKESVYIFSILRIEPWGRIGSGMAELIASLLLLYPAWRWWGALMGAGIMLGAIVSHVFVLGIEVQGDDGLLFSYACLALACCSACFFLHFPKYWLSAQKKT
jgi:hypothetical protein